MRILVVDDEQAVREALDRALRLEGYEVDLAGDGGEALALIAKRPPDAVVLDLMMPQVNGLEVCRRMRAGGDRTPVLILTARDGVSDRVTGLDAGADDYVVKPFALEELLARLRALVRRSLPGSTARRCALPTSRSTGVVRGQARRPGDRAHPHGVPAPRAVHAPPQTGVDTLGHLRAGLGVRLRPTSNSLTVYMGYLAHKTEAGGEPRLLQTVRGVGYVLPRMTPLPQGVFAAAEADVVPAAPDHAVRGRGGGRRRARVGDRLRRRSRRAAGAGGPAAAGPRRADIDSDAARRLHPGERRCHPAVRPLGDSGGYAQIVQPDGTVLRPAGREVEVPVTNRTLAGCARSGKGIVLEDETINGVHARVFTAPRIRRRGDSGRSFARGGGLDPARPGAGARSHLRLRDRARRLARDGWSRAPRVRPVSELTEAAEHVAETRDLSRRMQTTGDR